MSTTDITDAESARAALPEAVFSLPVFQPLEAAKDYVTALNIICLDRDLPEHFGKPLYRLVSDIDAILEAIGEELDQVYRLARRAAGLPDLPDDDDGNVEVEECDIELIALG